MSESLPSRTASRLSGLRILSLLFASSCSLLPSFSSPPPPLLLRQEPERPPLFVLHPPKDSPDELFFTGHSHKEKSPETARRKALARALAKLRSPLAQRGYVLSPTEAARWLREDPKGGPRVVDSWIRTYIQSSERPYIHQTSLYLLVSVPSSYLQRIIEALVQKDRERAKTLSRLYAQGEKELASGDGTRAFRDIRLALEASRKIHSLHSFEKSARDRIDRKRVAVAHLWRTLLRGLTLSLLPEQAPLVLREVPDPPARLHEKAFTRIRSRTASLWGLVFHGALLPPEKLEHLVFPSMAGIFKAPETPFSPETLFWETFLLRQPPYRYHPRLSLDCSPTGLRGDGVCLIRKVHIPLSRGTLEGTYQPKPGSPLDRPFFRQLFSKTLIDVHFTFYHRRPLFPLELSLPSSSDKEIRQAAENGLIHPLGRAGITLCLRKGPRTSCPLSPQGLSLPAPSTELAISALTFETSRLVHSNFSVTTVHLHMTVTLRSSQGLLLFLPLDVTGRGFGRQSALDQAFLEAGRQLAHLLPLVYLPDRPPHPGAAFYDF
ncbi:MAG: hypothetical protein ACP5OP_04480 [Leptospirillia bacterium]